MVQKQECTPTITHIHECVAPGAISILSIASLFLKTMETQNNGKTNILEKNMNLQMETQNNGKTNILEKNMNLQINLSF